ncbi:RNA polymerase sigma factor [Plantactinospora sonchi]|uniref:Sigma-70 family RNA polymerase sigma factor n=1 Tax=Plantactinospora sonchi TaxID=1544735 RepID=A0ABU7RXY6_9ACTN
MDGQQAVREVYAASAARLVAQLYGVTGDYAEAQDAVHEAFVRALARPGRFRQVANPEAWLRTVALNVARSRYRRRMVFDRLLRSGRLTNPDSGRAELSPDHVALVAALQRLPRATRESVVLHHIGDLSVAEVAATQNCSVEAVKTRLLRGRRALAAHLGEPDSGLPGPTTAARAKAAAGSAAAGDPAAAQPPLRRR